MTITWTPTFEWYMLRYKSNNEHQKEMCYKQNGLRVQNLVTILGSIVNMIEGDQHDHLMSTRSFTLIVNRLVLWAPKTKKVK